MDAAFDGMRVYDVLRVQLGASDGSVRRAKHLPAGLLLDGETTWTKARVRTGQEVSLVIDAPGMAGSSTDLVPEEGPVQVVFADDDVLVVEKPAGIVMYPSPGHPDGTLANRVAGWLRDRGRQCGLHAVHRLDRETSGLVVFALNSYAKDRVQDQLHTDAFVREYRAVCVGWPATDAGTIDAPLGKRSTSPNVFGVLPDGKPAFTHYQVLCRGNGPQGQPRALVGVRLETGRTHQIRIHLAHIGHPLVGDAAYGSASADIDRAALHSAYLAFTHPITGRHMQFGSPMPPDMRALLVGGQFVGDAPIW
ncbi:MAG: RluA family pseudouridine synthase [Coriobacteriia bacterium]|nr:RluA family pseudouridine synthase [Coriobacteriia bacterium]